MRDKPNAPPRPKRTRKAKPLGRMIEARQPAPEQPFDRKKSERVTRGANQAADRLLREMDAFLKNAGRKP